MLQEIGEALRTICCITRHPGGNGARDEEQLTLDRGRHSPRPPLDDPVQAHDRLLQALHHDQHGVLALPVLRERDDLSHGAIMRPPSDTPGRFRSFEQDLGLDPAIRDESCGARRS
jgi:hypothetical protein